MTANGKHQVSLVTVEPYAGTDIPYKFVFTLVDGGALWEYTPMVGLIAGEDGSRWTADTWLQEWVTYPTDSTTKAGQHLERAKAFHADLDAQR